MKFELSWTAVSLKNIKCKFIEAHQKVWASYQSPVLNKNEPPVKKEISDLITLIICNDMNKEEIRISFMQAKWTGSTPERVPLRSFEGDYFQWELLFNRPSNIVISKNTKLHLPDLSNNILSICSDYKSITNFGIFYKDFNGKIDMLYAIPELLYPSSIPSKKSQKKITFYPQHQTINCFPNLTHRSRPAFAQLCPRPFCYNFTDDVIMRMVDENELNEAIYIHNVNKYSKYILNGSIGFPVSRDKELLSIIKLYVNSINNDNVILNTFLININKNYK